MIDCGEHLNKFMNINVKNLSKKFNSFVAVDNINFTLERNKTLGLLGPNGCGKTTSIGMMLGLITPTSGEVLIDNKNVNEVNRNDLLSRMNFASPYIELPKKLTVRQNLEVYGRLYGVKDLKNRVSEISEDLGLDNFLDKKTGELSSGQKNRVSLAKSLINKPEVLFLDEPTASLDPDIGDFVRNYIESYKTKNNITILLASHNMNEVERLCDTVIMMKKGKIVDKGTCAELIIKHGRDNLEDTFLKIARSSNEMA
jgi:ABC-2 type transport system ATP-binding protein